MIKAFIIRGEARPRVIPTQRRAPIKNSGKDSENIRAAQTKIIMANKKQTANAQKQARPVFNLTRTQVLRMLVNECDAHLGAALNMTKNGTLKLTGSRPECKEDIKNTVSVGDKVFYLVPSSPNMKGVVTALNSYHDYLEAVRIQAKKQENTKDFETWCNTADSRRQFAAARKYAPKSVADDTIWKDLYNDYLATR